MKVHELKILPQYYEAVRSRQKTFELRKNDRDFKEGDLIVLREYDGEKYTGRKITEKPIKYVLKDCSEYGLEEGYCIIGF